MEPPTIDQIIAQFSQSHPMQQSQQLEKLPTILPESVKKTIAKYPITIKTAEFYVAVYFPDTHYAQGKNLMGEIAHLLGGATATNGLLGLWENPMNKSLVPDDIFLIKSFTDTQGLIDNLAKLIERVCYWGRVCNQSVMAVEIGSLMGSIMLLISVP